MSTFLVQVDDGDYSAGDVQQAIWEIGDVPFAQIDVQKIHPLPLTNTQVEGKHQPSLLAYRVEDVA
jgi:hypothetical protein